MEKRQVKIDFYTKLYGKDFIYIDTEGLSEGALERAFAGVISEQTK